MPKPIFNPTQYELRNQLPAVVSDEQASQIAQATQRVNDQLNWVAQILGWNGANYWDSLTTTVHQKRALLGGSFGVYNSYTLLPLVEVRQWENLLVTEKRPNIAIGQRVIIGDQQTYIYDLNETDLTLELNIGAIPQTILTLLEQGAAVRVDCPENRPFPFHRPTPEASADAYFRCSVGATTLENDFYRYANLVLTPFDQNNLLLPYENLCLFGGSYYYFDRAVYISYGRTNLAPWLESQWIESNGLWQIFIPEDIIGNELTIVWDYALENTEKRVIASKKAQVIQWTDPSDWGNGGSFFNPVLDEFTISKTYNTAGLNYSLGTRLALGDQPPFDNNPLWYNAGDNSVYAYVGNQWNKVGVVSGAYPLDGASAPPPATYEYRSGNIWQDPEGQVYVWDAGFENYDFFYFFPNGIIDGFFYIDPSYQNVQGLYIFDPDNFYIHNPNYLDYDGFVVYNLQLNDEGFYVSDPFVRSPDWFKVDFFSESTFQAAWVPTYASNLYLLVDGTEVPGFYRTSDYEVSWESPGQFFRVTYRALTEQGELFVPSLTIGSFNGSTTQYIDISGDFTSRQEVVTSVPYSEIGVLNNFRGVWGNKGGARSMDFVFDSLDIHGYNEQQALMLRDVNQPISFDDLLGLVSGSNVFVGDSPPPAGTPGDYYWNNETGSLAVLYTDRDNLNYWVEVDYPIPVCSVGNPECSYSPLKPFLSSGGCSLSNGDTWEDPETGAVVVWYDSSNGTSSWVEMNWNIVTGEGLPASQIPVYAPNFDVLKIYLTDDFIPITEGQSYTTSDYTFYYTVDDITCEFIFHYQALSPLGVQTQPTVWVAIASNLYPPQSITEWVFSNAQWYLAPVVQNSEWTLRPWKTQALQVTTEEAIYTDTYGNGFAADTNLGPGDEDWTKSFVRLPSEYGRDGKVWNQAKLAMQDFAYFGYSGALRDMRCPAQDTRPQIFEEVVFYRKSPEVGSILFSAPYWYSDVEGFNNLISYFPDQQVTVSGFSEADFDFVTDDPYDEWVESELTNYDPLHHRTIIPGGNWDGFYTEPTGTGYLSGFIERDIRVKSVIPMPPPVWDASIYKYPPLCPQGPESYVEDVNNYKVNYAYFAADLAAAEDGFFDQSKDVAWREPLQEDQTLYILNN